MDSINQKCGCGNSDALVPLQLKVPTDNCGCQTLKSKTAGDSKNKSFIIDEIQTPAGMIPHSSKLNLRDYLGAFKVRWGIGRNNYRVAPGLYAVGTPNEYSDVFVTANYKLTFDKVPQESK